MNSIISNNAVLRLMNKTVCTVIGQSYIIGGRVCDRLISQY